MKLWLDGQCLQTASRSRGIGRYAFELTRAIAQNARDIEILVSLNAQMAAEAIAARAALEGIVAPHNIHVWQGVASRGEAVDGYSVDRQLSEAALVHHVNCLQPDVALSLSPFEGQSDPAVPLLPHRSLSVPAMGIFYDAIPLRFKKVYLDTAEKSASYDRRLKACAGFERLLCISEFSVAEARDLLGKVNAVNISAGVSDDLTKLVDQTRAEKRPSRPFVFYAGGFDWRKNVAILPAAFALLPPQLRNQLDLVLVGDHTPDLFGEIVKRWAALGLDGDALQSKGLVTDSQLYELYRTASVVVQPSFMEGFGLTALEALMCGTPVIAARAGAMPEVVKLDRLLFDPHAPADLAAKIVDVLGDPNIRETIAALGREMTSKFTWKNSAQITAETVRQIAGTHKTTHATMQPETSRQSLAESVSSIADVTRRKAEVMARAETHREAPRRLLVDVTSTIQYQNRTGIQRVVRKISNAMSADGSADGTPIVTIYCDDETGWYDVKGRLDEAAQKSTAARIAPSGNDCVIMLDSSWNVHALHRPFLRETRLRGGEVVSCLYDLVPLRSSAFCDGGMPPIFRAWFMHALDVSTGVVCISKAVADELLQVLEAIEFPRRIKVGYWRLGADFIASSSPDAPAVSQPTKARPMLLMVGTLEPRKGHAVALDAFERAWAAGLDADLVIVGKQGWQTQALADRIRGHAEFGRRLMWHDTVSDEMLSGLYRECDGLVAASYAEGFGLPIVEAGHFGKPVLASDLPVFREIASGAPHVMFFDVGSAESLAQRLPEFVRLLPGLSQTEEASRSWPNWSESARELENVVLNGDWYRTFEPKSPERFVSLGNIGRVRGEASLPGGAQDSALKLVDAEMTDAKSDCRITLAVSNQSQAPWFGFGDEDGRFAVGVGYDVLDGNGNKFSVDSQPTMIPLVLAPGDTQYMSITIPAQQIKHAVAVDVKVVQKAATWQSHPLRVPLPKSAQPRR